MILCAKAGIVDADQGLAVLTSAHAHNLIHAVYENGQEVMNALSLKLRETVNAYALNHVSALTAYIVYNCKFCIR